MHKKSAGLFVHPFGRAGERPEVCAALRQVTCSCLLLLPCTELISAEQVSVSPRLPDLCQGGFQQDSFLNMQFYPCFSAFGKWLAVQSCSSVGGLRVAPRAALLGLLCQLFPSVPQLPPRRCELPELGRSKASLRRGGEPHPHRYRQHERVDNLHEEARAV